MTARFLEQHNFFGARPAATALCECEIAPKDARRIDMALGRARFPMVRELSEYDFAVQPAVDKQQIRELVSRRYERGSIRLTSNRAVSEWGAVFGDPVIATAILDPLLHRSHVITIRGESNRLNDKRRAGLLTAHRPHDQHTAPSPQGVNS